MTHPPPRQMNKKSVKKAPLKRTRMFRSSSTSEVEEDLNREEEEGETNPDTFTQTRNKRKSLSAAPVPPLSKEEKKGKKAPTKIGKWKTDLSDDAWEDVFSAAKIQRKVPRKKRKIGITKAEKKLTRSQKQTVKAITGNFNIMSAIEIAAEAIKSVDDGEAARDKCTNIKGDLDRRIKLVVSRLRSWPFALIWLTYLRQK